MSSVSIEWDRRALQELRALPQAARRRIYAAIGRLRDDPLRGAALSGRWRGLRKLRVGSYRVIYGFDGELLQVAVVRVGHRREAYR